MVESGEVGVCYSLSYYDILEHKLTIFKKKGEKMEECYIQIPVKYREKDYLFTAYKRDEDGRSLYILRHLELWNYFQDVLRTYKDVRISMPPIEVGTQHNVVSCTITSEDHVTPLTFIGETVTRYLSNIGQTSPFQIAWNRAFDKAALEFFGILSKKFTEDGLPIIYSSDEEPDYNTPENSEATETEVKAKVDEPDEKKVEREKRELVVLGNSDIQIEYKKKLMTGKVKKLTESSLQKILEDTSQEGMARKKIVSKYIELCQKYPEEAKKLQENDDEKNNAGNSANS